MPDQFNNPPNFWQELKRRKVIRVIVIYAAAALAILEAVDIIFPRMGFPDWTITFVIFLLVIGFVITLVLSWIYDITPEGIEKTKPAKEAIEEVPDKPSGRNAWKIATIISVVVIISLIIINIISRRGKVEDLVILDKSIAVLPFKYLSDDPDEQYLADGTMDEILLNLQKIKDLRVMSRTSVEQYRNTDKTITEISLELDVAYLIEASFQKFGDQVRLFVQLISPGKEDHIWAEQYNRDWKDIFSVQSEVAQTIAQELQAVITPEEKQLIDKIPTDNLTAYEFYQKGREEYFKYSPYTRNTESLDRAEVLFRYALDYDSTFAQAYNGITMIYWNKNSLSSYSDKNISDSILIRTDIALSFDDQIEETYLVRAEMYKRRGDLQQAEENYEIALSINPNYAIGLDYAGEFYLHDINDYVKGFTYLHKAASIDRSPYLSVILRTLSYAYSHLGFFDEAIFYNQEALKLDDDSIAYYMCLSDIEYNSGGNPTDRLRYRLKAYEMDTTNTRVIDQLASSYNANGRYEESLKYWEKYLAIKKARGEQIGNRVYQKIGRAYWNNGYKEEANYYFNEQINVSNRVIEVGGSNNRVKTSHYLRLATANAFLGDMDKSLEYLRILNQKERLPAWILRQIKTSPSLDNIRDESEFQQILQDVEAKFHAEREKVRQWLVENDML